MICLKSPLNGRKNSPSPAKRNIGHLKSPLSANKLKRTKIPSLHSHKRGVSLSKKHSVAFDRIYSEKDLQGRSHLQQNVLSQTKNDSENSKFNRDTFKRACSQCQLRSQMTSEKSSSRIQIGGKVRIISVDRDDMENGTMSVIDRLNMIEERTENSFQNT